MKRYEALADKIDKMIRQGMLKAGDKIPSVRQASSQFAVSPSTVFKAYYQLENRGLIHGLERSGYYVSEYANNLLPEPAPSRPPKASAKVKVNELVFSVLDAMQDTDTAPLGTAFPSLELFPHQQLTQSLNRANRKNVSLNGGSHIGPGDEGLRKAIALRYMTAGVEVTADDVIITNGAMEGLTLALQAITQPGDVVAIESPGFYAALQTIESLGLKAVEIPMDSQQGLNLESLETACKEKNVRACWCMTNFQNPLGATMPESKKRKLVELLGKYNVPLIEDDVYGELYFGKKYQRPAKTFDTQGLVIHCSSFSKTLAPTYRIGWVLAGRYYEKIRRVKLMTTLSTSLPAQLAIADYLNRGNYDRHLRQFRRLLEDQQAQMAKAIAANFPQGTKVSRPRGGFFLWVELPKAIDALALYHLALKQGINFAPGSIFSCRGDYRHCIRLNYGQPMGRITSAIETVGQLAYHLSK